MAAKLPGWVLKLTALYHILEFVLNNPRAAVRLVQRATEQKDPSGRTTDNSQLVDVLPCGMSIRALNVGIALATWSAGTSICALEHSKEGLTLLRTISPDWLRSRMDEVIATSQNKRRGGEAGSSEYNRPSDSSPLSKVRRTATAGGMANHSPTKSLPLSTRSEDVKAGMIELIAAMCTQKPSAERKAVTAMAALGELFNSCCVDVNGSKTFYPALCCYFPTATYYQSNGLFKSGVTKNPALLKLSVPGKSLNIHWFKAGEFTVATINNTVRSSDAMDKR